jgi:signal transduction histidine kinase
VRRSPAWRRSRGRFEVGLADALSCISGVPIRVRQIIANLSENAIKFTPSGGLVSISARYDATAERVVLLVTDTGCGVPAEHLDQIFEKLHQVPDSGYHTRRGLGLGLYITRELVHGLGGEIRVQSEPGQGSRFEIALPAFTWRGATTRLVGSATRPTGLHALAVLAEWSHDASTNRLPPRRSP